MSNDSSHVEQPPSCLPPWHWGWSAALAMIVLITLAFRYALPVRDGDLWFHMLYGKYFLDYKTLIADHTIFSWTPTTNDTIYCTWLPDIFLYLLHKVAGLPGIFAFRYLCMLVPVLGCFFYARKLKISTHPLTWLLCLLAVIMSYTAAFEKPEILSFVFMTLLAWNWWHLRSSDESAWKSCYLFPLITLVWVNTHGGFVFGAMFLLLLWLGELLNTYLCPQNTLPPKIRKHLTIALLITAFTPLLNPYGYRYPLQLFFDLLPTEANTNYNKKIAAYDSPFAFADTYLFTLGADTVIGLLFLFYLRNFKKTEWSSLLTNLVFAFLYTRFFRTTFYWVPVFLFSGLHLLSLEPLVPTQWKYAQQFSKILPAVVAIASLLLAGNSLYNSYLFPEKYLWMGFGISDANPERESEYIKKYFPHARIGNTYDQGAYLLWKLWPENTVFFDARHFPYREWSDVFFHFSGGGNIREMSEKYPCDLWCVGLRNSPLAMGLLLNKEWQLAFYGKNSAVIVRSDITLPEGAPRVSADIDNLKNLNSALDIFQFAVHIGDFETAEHLLLSMKKQFPYTVQSNTIRWAGYYLYGLKAYQEKNYGLAARKLGFIADPPDHLRYILTNCYQFLTQRAWVQNDLSSAMRFARKSLVLVPDNPYSLYNIGAIGWRQEKEKSNTPRSMPGAVENPKIWQTALEQFSQQVQADPYFTHYSKTATAMLKNRQSEHPPLLLPVEPRNKKLFSVPPFPEKQRESLVEK